MIRTAEPVSYNLVDISLKEIVYAKVISALRNDENETYTLNIKEWVEIPYTENVPDGNGGTVSQSFVNVKEIRVIQRTMTFAEADQLTAYLDSVFTINEQGSSRRKKYTLLGHLVINNQENVRNVSWELV
jgi:hypothetical protein